MDRDLRCVFIANGEVQAQQVAAFLRAHGIDSTLLGESTRRTHGLTLDGLGAAEICVSARDEEQAAKLLKSAEAGEFRLDENPGA
jgi:hypothetical protein